MNGLFMKWSGAPEQYFEDLLAMAYFPALANLQHFFLWGFWVMDLKQFSYKRESALIKKKKEKSLEMNASFNNF